eukprot:116852-Chlamydomonas_euryale.AAC.3
MAQSRTAGAYSGSRSVFVRCTVRLSGPFKALGWAAGSTASVAPASHAPSAVCVACTQQDGRLCGLAAWQPLTLFVWTGT